MRVKHLFVAFLSSMFLLAGANAQVVSKVNSVKNSVNDASSTVSGTTSAITGGAASLVSAKNALQGMFAGKPKDSYFVAIAGIEDGNEDLDQLKHAIKNAKGVKEMATNFKDGTITIVIKGKSNASEIWDSLSKTDKQAFRIVQEDEKSILLEYKNKATDQTKVVSKN